MAQPNHDVAPHVFKSGSMAWLPCYVRVRMPMNSATRQDQRDCAAENAVCRNMLQPETALTASFERLEQSIDIKLGSVVHFCEEPVWTGGIRVKLVAVHVRDRLLEQRSILRGTDKSSHHQPLAPRSEQAPVSIRLLSGLSRSPLTPFPHAPNAETRRGLHRGRCFPRKTPGQLIRNPRVQSKTHSEKPRGAFST